MIYGICHLSIIPMRAEPSDPSELVSQVLYGEHFKVLERRKKWSRISLAFDGYEGWIDNKQFQEIDENLFFSLDAKPIEVAQDLVECIWENEQLMFPIHMGSHVSGAKLLNQRYEGKFQSGQQSKTQLPETAALFLNTPYLWGGKTAFGIDCSGFVQTVYKINGYKLLRDAAQQATQGEVLSFIEESEPGDLAFFDNSEGVITHVGMILPQNHIIHAFGKVRIDRIDQSGIFNTELNRHTHKLRVIKRIV